MNFKEYNDAISRIHADLEKIAERTLNQALVNCADWSNPAFQDLMHRHIELTKLSSALTEMMFEQLKTK